MIGTTKRRVGFGALTGLVIAGVIGVNAMNVSGQVVTDADPYPPTSTPYGTLTIDLTNRAGSVTVQRGTDTITQAIRTTQPCAKVVLDPIRVNNVPIGDTSATLLDFEALLGNPANGSLAPGGTVQIPSTLLGVEGSSNCGEPSGQLGPNEALRLSLGSFIDESVSVTSGSLAIGKKSHSGQEPTTRLRQGHVRRGRLRHRIQYPRRRCDRPQRRVRGQHHVEVDGDAGQPRLVAQGRDHLQPCRPR